VELTVSYRTPQEVLDAASKVLELAEPSMRPPRPVRTTGTVPDLRVVAPEVLHREIVEASARELTAVAPGRVAILAPPDEMAAIMTSLHASGLAAVDPRMPSGEGLAANLVVLPAGDANGLEFDSVIVVQPARVAHRGGSGHTPTQRGLRTLYVAMTRPTRRLTVLGTEPIPSGQTSSAQPQMWHVEAAIN
jgi:DNA helicase IV